MSLHKRKKPKKDELIIDNAKAELIYSFFADGEDENQLFIKRGISFKSSKLVKEAFKRIETEANIIMNGNLVKKEATYGDEGEVLTEVVYETIPVTQAALIKLITGDLLDVSIVVADIVNFSEGDPDNPPTWEEYKLSFEELEII